MYVCLYLFIYYLCEHVELTHGYTNLSIIVQAVAQDTYGLAECTEGNSSAKGKPREKNVPLDAYDIK